MKQKILKENLWNLLFHSKILRRQRSKYWRCKALISNFEQIFKTIDDALSLNELLAAHKKAWIYGFRNENLGPNQYGMFRTDKISNMTQDEVYLGNINGLWTHTIREWNERADEGAYETVMEQYRMHLESNVIAIDQGARKYVRDYEM